MSIKYEQNPEAIDAMLKARKMELDSGILGRLFGSPAHSPKNISGLLIFLLTITGIIISLLPGEYNQTDYWSITTPIITLALGFLFGKSA